MVSERGMLAEGVSWLGRPESPVLAELFRRAWVFCMPSTYEGFGVPYIEAMASGTPVVTTPNPGAAEVLAQGRHGLIAAAQDLGRAVSDLLDDAGRRNQMSQRGLARAAEYSFDRVADQYAELFACVTGEARHVESETIAN